MNRDNLAAAVLAQHPRGSIGFFLEPEAVFHGHQVRMIYPKLSPLLPFFLDPSLNPWYQITRYCTCAEQWKWLGRNRRKMYSQGQIQEFKGRRGFSSKKKKKKKKKGGGGGGGGGGGRGPTTYLGAIYIANKQNILKKRGGGPGHPPGSAPDSSRTEASILSCISRRCSNLLDFQTTACATMVNCAAEVSSMQWCFFFMFVRLL